MSIVPPNVGVIMERIEELTGLLGRLTVLYAEADSLAYSGSGQADAKVRVERSDPTGDVAVDVKTEEVRGRLRTASGAVDYMVRSARNAVSSLEGILPSTTAGPSPVPRPRGLDVWTDRDISEAEERARRRRRTG